mgnify:CR=1 FL=1
MTSKEKANDIRISFHCPELQNPLYGVLNYAESIGAGLISVDRNIKMFTELVNKMDDFSNESRQVVWQLIENENKIKEELIESLPY